MVIKIFKHLFIPHKHNSYKPHFFREISTASILIVVVVLLSISVGADIYIKQNNLTSAVLPAVLVDLTNQSRVSNGVLALEKDSLLEEAARLKAEDMANNQYFSHTSPQGLTPWSWFNKVGYYFLYAGENLAIDFTESVNVENAWLNSPTHKANILNSRFTEIGIATKGGYYNGYPTIYVVQMFGTPAFASSREIETPPVVAPEVKTIQEEVSPVTVVVVPEVKGESVIIPEELETITETTEFIAVKNTVAIEEIAPQVSTENIKYSTWKERLTFKFPEYTDRIYRIFVWIILIALVLMMIVEIRRQHSKNIIYGILLIVIIFSFMFINKSMFITSLLI